MGGFRTVGYTLGALVLGFILGKSSGNFTDIPESDKTHPQKVEFTASGESGDDNPRLSGNRSLYISGLEERIEELTDKVVELEGANAPLKSEIEALQNEKRRLEQLLESYGIYTYSEFVRPEGDTPGERFLRAPEQYFANPHKGYDDVLAILEAAISRQEFMQGPTYVEKIDTVWAEVDFEPFGGVENGRKYLHFEKNLKKSKYKIGADFKPGLSKKIPFRDVVSLSLNISHYESGGFYAKIVIDPWENDDAKVSCEVIYLPNDEKTVLKVKYFIQNDLRKAVHYKPGDLEGDTSIKTKLVDPFMSLTQSIDVVADAYK